MKKKIIDLLWYIVGIFVTIITPPAIAGLGAMIIRNECGLDSGQMWLWCPMMVWLLANYIIYSMKQGKEEKR